MSISLGLGLGLPHLQKNDGIVPEPPSGQLEIDGFPILVDTFQIIFS